MKPRLDFAAAAVFAWRTGAVGSAPMGEPAKVSTRTRTAAAPEHDATAGEASPRDAREQALEASRERVIAAIQDQLDALDEEIGLGDTQRTRLEAAFTDERERGVEALAELRRGLQPADRIRNQLHGLRRHHRALRVQPCLRSNQVQAPLLESQTWPFSDAEVQGESLQSFCTPSQRSGAPG